MRWKRSPERESQLYRSVSKWMNVIQLPKLVITLTCRRSPVCCTKKSIEI